MKKRIVQFLTIALISLSFCSIALAQTNYANIKVDEISDAQIRQMMESVKSVGYTDAQLEQVAAARGMKPEEVQKLSLRVEKIRKQSADNPTANTTNEDDNQGRKNTNGDKKDSTNVNKPISIDVLDALKPKIFGSELFKNSNITFEPNLRIATPKSYIIGPDDELLIDLTGDNEANYRLKVSPDGTIRVQYVGLIAVGGLSIEQATSKIRSAMSRTYSALNSGRSNIAINLGNIRSIKVVITGYVVKPGTYTLSSLSTVFNALNASGGPNDNGSYRKIQVIRNNKVVATIDTYDFIINGIQKGNIRLQDQDVINVPVYQTRVEMVGEIKTSALFETKTGESLQDVLNFAGGFNNQAYTAAIKVFQNTAKERKITDIASANFSTYEPQNGDRYIVEAILDRFENRVTVQGAVFRPGQYELESGLTLKGLLAKANGLTEDAFLNRGYINRLNADNTAALLSFDVAKIIDGSESDIPLQREDKIIISSLFDLRDEYKVSIQGEVRKPATFEYAENMTLEAAIQMAGGFKEGATPNRIEISRRVKNSDVNAKGAKIAELFTVNVDENLRLQGTPFILQPFDIISVRNSESYAVQKQVKLEGEVLFPGLYTITNKDDRISDLIARAGGLTSSAFADGASLKRPGAQKVNPNDKNAINNKEEEERKFLALKRAQEAGVKDTLATNVEQQLIESDLVGINLVRILDQPKSKVDLFVEDGDIIRVPRQLQTVKVTGEILSPNSIVFLPGRSLKQYINGAGGFTANARKNGVYVKYSNGAAAAVGKFLFFNNYPKIKPGAEILVPKRAEREKISAQAWIGIGTGIASLGAIIVSLLR